MEEADIEKLPAYDVLKVKVGVKPVADEARKINKLRMYLSTQGRSTRLRLDANQAWNLETAVSFAKALGNYRGIEYIEEPLQNPLELPEFYKQTSLPYAVDESFSDGVTPIKGLGSMHGLAALVLKPAMMGGFERCALVLDHLPENVEGVISCAFESSISLSHMAVFASVYCRELTCHGLGTYDRLKTDAVEDGFGKAVISNGTVDVQKCGEILDRALASVI
mmetsp:Transcript_10185/g.17519  ORF Transcript_10185/g.17519 Transcript_10185/m.17519 type:complete len:222 (+) Transcript_10185:3-668(+)